MTYRSDLGPYTTPRALISATSPRITKIHKTVSDGFVQNQKITLTPQGPSVVNNQSEFVSIDVHYDMSTRVRTTGFGFRLHYDSSKLTLHQVINRYPLQSTGYLHTDDLGDFDNELSTDKVVSITWQTDDNNWPDEAFNEPLLIATFVFELPDVPQSSFVTPVNTSPLTTATGFSFLGQDLLLGIENVSWDFDGNGELDALTDGLIFLRFLFGVGTTGNDVDVLVGGAIATNSPYKDDPIQVYERTLRVRETIGDIDGNGVKDALTDGLLLLRYLFGLRGNSLIQGAVGSSYTTATRTTSDEIVAYIEKFYNPDLSDEFVETLFIDHTPPPADSSGSEVRASLDVSTPRAILSKTQPAVTKATLVEPSVSLTKAIAKAAITKPAVSVVAPKVYFSQPKAIVVYSGISAIYGGMSTGRAPEIGETVAFSDNVESILSAVRQPVETLSVADNVHTIYTAKRDIIDSVSVQDVPELIVSFKRDITDGFSIDDYFTSLGTELADKTNIANVSDEFSHITAFDRRPTSDLSLESLTSFAVSKPTIDSIGFSDVFDRVFSSSRELIEEVGVTSLPLLKISKPLSEAVAISDDINLVSGKGFVDFVEASERVAAERKYIRAYFDALSISDVADVADNSVSTSISGTVLTDTTAIVASFVRDFDDSFILDSNAVLSNTSSDADTFGVIDDPILSVGFGRSFTDTRSITDTDTLVIGKTEVENLLFSEARTMVIGKDSVDNLEADEFVVREASYARAFSDEFSLGDHASYVEANSEFNFDSTSLLDIVSTSLDAVRSFTDTSSLADTINLKVGKEELDTFGVSDTSEISIGFRRPSIANSIAMQDSFSLKPGKAVTDPLGISDNAVKSIKPAFDTRLGASETLNITKFTTRYFADAVEIKDVFQSSESNIFGSLSAASMKDEVAFKTSFKRSLTDNLGVLEQISKKVSTATIDTAEIKDEVLLASTFKHFIDDSLKVSDIVRHTQGAALSDAAGLLDETDIRVGKNPVEFISSSEIVVAAREYYRDATDVIGLADIVDMSEANYAFETHPAVLTDSFARVVSFERSLVSDVSFLSSAEFSIDKPFGDTTDIFDEIILSSSMHRGHFDSIGIDDPITKKLNKSFSNGVSVQESTSFSAGVDLISHQEVSEVVSSERSYIRSVDDIFRLDDLASLAEDNAFDKSNKAFLTDNTSLQVSFFREPIDPVSFSSDVLAKVSKPLNNTFTVSDVFSYSLSFKGNLIESTAGVSDSVQFKINKDFSDAVAFGEYVNITTGKAEITNLQSSELIAYAREYIRNVSSTFSLGDTIDLSEDNFEATVSSAGVTDQTALKFSAERHINNSIDITSNVYKKLNKSFGDTATLIDTVILKKDDKRSDLNNPVTFSDTQLLSVGKSFSDTFGTTEYVQKNIGSDRNDYLQADETFATAKKYIRTVSNELKIVDSTDVAEQNKSSKVDKTQLKEEFSTVFTAERAFSENNILLDTVAKKVRKSFSEGLSIGDSVLTEVDKPLSEIESISYSDTVEFILGRNVSSSATVSDDALVKLGKSADDSLAPLETIVPERSYKRAAQDAFTLDDTFNKLGEFNNVKTNVAILGDEVSKTVTFNRAFSDTFTLTSSVLKALKTDQGTSAIQAQDTVIESYSSPFDTEVESLGLQEQALFKLGKSFADNASVTDTVIVKRGKGYNSDLIATEALARDANYYRSLGTETFDLSDNISKLINISPANSLIGLIDDVTLTLTTAAPLDKAINTSAINTKAIN